ncbi:MFS transporter [Gracilibacillus sp. S3-1-1]|uniref:MFS transporter n=1 Tax=Gracilibacillus pellucidus TaxID=3095368 RepID=A0ACC6M6E4_9BACI|nr:MFS transporter [Gracilibacillus sp. S3-1-1]MDX8046490.1 MFS transporter [Gracilibacillus sp. S3-1-1]
MNTNTKTPLWSLSFIFITVANALLFMIFEMLLPTLPLFVVDIGGSSFDVGLVTGLFMVSAILIRPFAGILLQLMDKKYLLIIGILINALATGAYYVSSDVTILFIIRLIHGAGFGLASTYFATIAAEIVPKERRGEGIGYFGVGETIAISVGPMIGIMILEWFDFQQLFIGGMSVLLLAILSVVMVKRPKVDASSDVAKMKVKLFDKRVLAPSLLVLLLGIAASGIMSFLSLYAVEKGFNHVGLFFFLIAAASFLVRLISGRLFDLHGPTIILIPGAILSIIGFGFLYFAQHDWMFYIAAIFYGFGFGAIFPAIQTWCINLVEEGESEYAMASFFNFFDLGIGSGSLIFGSLAISMSYGFIYVVAIFVYLLFLIMYILIMINKRRTKKVAS